MECPRPERDLLGLLGDGGDDLVSSMQAHGDDTLHYSSSATFIIPGDVARRGTVTVGGDAVYLAAPEGPDGAALGITRALFADVLDVGTFADAPGWLHLELSSEVESILVHVPDTSLFCSAFCEVLPIDVEEKPSVAAAAKQLGLGPAERSALGLPTSAGEESSASEDNEVKKLEEERRARLEEQARSIERAAESSDRLREARQRQREADRAAVSEATEAAMRKVSMRRRAASAVARKLRQRQDSRSRRPEWWEGGYGRDVDPYLLDEGDLLTMKERLDADSVPVDRVSESGSASESEASPRTPCRPPRAPSRESAGASDLLLRSALCRLASAVAGTEQVPPTDAGAVDDWLRAVVQSLDREREEAAASLQRAADAESHAPEQHVPVTALPVCFAQDGAAEMAVLLASAGRVSILRRNDCEELLQVSRSEGCDIVPFVPAAADADAAQCMSLAGRGSDHLIGFSSQHLERLGSTLAECFGDAASSHPPEPLASSDVWAGLGPAQRERMLRPEAAVPSTPPPAPRHNATAESDERWERTASLEAELAAAEMEKGRAEAGLGEALERESGLRRSLAEAEAAATRAAEAHRSQLEAAERAFASREAELRDQYERERQQLKRRADDAEVEAGDAVRRLEAAHQDELARLRTDAVWESSDVRPDVGALRTEAASARADATAANLEAETLRQAVADSEVALETALGRCAELQAQGEALSDECNSLAAENTDLWNRLHGTGAGDAVCSVPPSVQRSPSRSPASPSFRSRSTSMPHGGGCNTSRRGESLSPPPR
eukprot:TRINITY_DN14564_c0_g1_i3.p1 TRINITY_DN14564_c0_g1~~TRINITY_DN14564_c0_g1_i3.p1  ORF type:complete len:786 (+),score=214.05 TRINITY_DN14564_c0_g1_i3:85-2442(+)